MPPVVRDGKQEDDELLTLSSTASRPPFEPLRAVIESFEEGNEEVAVGRTGHPSRWVSCRPRHRRLSAPHLNSRSTTQRMPTGLSPASASSSSASNVASTSAHRLDDGIHNDRSNRSSSSAADEGDISCLICLASANSIVDRAALPLCMHSLFCFPCIIRWADVKRSCPLCNREIGPYILHDIESEREYKRHYLRPHYGSKEKANAQLDERLAHRSIEVERLHRQRRQLAQSPGRSSRPPPVAPREGELSGWTEWARQERQDFRNDPLTHQTRALDRRKLVYRNHLFALHIGSNRYTQFKAPPTTSQLVQNEHLVTNLLPFLRREIMALPLGPSVDVHFLTTYVVSILKSLDIRSEGAARLLDDLFGDRVLAEHFCHEIMTFLRSGARSCTEYDRRAQYRWPWMTSTDPRRTEDGAQKSGLGSGSEEGRSDRQASSMGATHRRDNDASASLPPDVDGSTHSRLDIDDRQSDPDDEAALSLAPPREEIIARRSQLLARLAREKQALRQQDVIKPDLGVQKPSSSSAELSPGSSSHLPNDSREQLLRRLALERRQLHAHKADQDETPKGGKGTSLSPQEDQMRTLENQQDRESVLRQAAHEARQRFQLTSRGLPAIAK